MKNKKLIISTVIGITALAVISFYQFFQSNSSDKLVLSINNSIQTFDPAIVFNDDAMLVMGQSLESLYQYHYLKRPYEVIPALAKALPEISANGKVYTFKIKKGIKYHDRHHILPLNRDVKAIDFVWAIKRLAYAPLKSNGKWLFSGRIKGFNKFGSKVGDSIEAFYKNDIEGVKAIDDYTLEISLHKPEPNFLYFLTMHFTSPVPVEAIKYYKNDFSKELFGTGPYQYINFKDNTYYFERFTNFREEFYPSAGDRYANTEMLLSSSKKKLPLLGKVEFKVIKEEASRWSSFLNHEIDILDVPKQIAFQLSNPKSEMNETFEDKGIIIKHFSRQTTRWLGLNMNDPVVGANLNLRKAIAHGIDFDQYIKVLSNNTNLRSNSIINPSLDGYKPEHKLPYQYDLEKAKTYFKQSGYKPGELELTYSTRGTDDIHLVEANFIKGQLAKIGINLKINIISFSEFLKLGRANKLQIWTDNWIYDYPDTENILQLLVSKNSPGINKSGYANKSVDGLYAELSTSLDPQKRKQITYEIESLVEKDLPWILLMYESSYIVQQSNLQNFRKSYFIRNFAKYLDKHL